MRFNFGNSFHFTCKVSLSKRYCWYHEKQTTIFFQQHIFQNNSHLMAVTVMGNSHITTPSMSSMSSLSSKSSMSYVSVMSGMLSVSDAFHDSIEPTMRTSVVLHNSSSTIGFFQRVRTGHFLSVSMFELGFLITSVRIFYSILKFVRCWTLQGKVLVDIEMIDKVLLTLSSWWW
jgi:hypothetical protein